MPHATARFRRAVDHRSADSAENPATIADLFRRAAAIGAPLPTTLILCSGRIGTSGSSHSPMA